MDLIEHECPVWGVFAVFAVDFTHNRAREQYAWLILTLWAFIGEWTNVGA
jgi:hypothetical protein